MRRHSWRPRARLSDAHDDVDGFWGPLRSLVDRIVEQGFAHPDHARLFRVVSSVREVFEALEAAPPTSVHADAKWT